MTPEDQSLDPEFFLIHQPLILYRIARTKFANLSGVGAALAPGRWNFPGEEAIYTSTEAGVPVLEMLAHTPKDLIPSNLALMRIRVRGGWEAIVRNPVYTILHLFDPQTNGLIWLFPSLAVAKKALRYSESGASFFGSIPFAVAVPSVIVPVWNVILFPQATGFWDHVSLESVEPFQFDPRLFPENTPIEIVQEGTTSQLK